MANSKDQNINSMTIEEVNVQVLQLTTKLRKAQFSAALGTLENPSVLRSYKKDIARLKTVLKTKDV